LSTITVRNLPKTLVQTLKEIAQKNHHSMEQEVRIILSNYIMDRVSAMKYIEALWEKNKRKIHLEEAEEWLAQAREWRK